ncbi:MAG: Hef nuclease [Candidatus Altiarchaeales archaeon]|nr:MAG: Hef nuclease [Candidatus Altiarchaeales archaeon]
MYVTHPLIKSDAISLRRYQEAIVSRALDANTLVVLPTGLGKTVIAAMVAAHRLKKFQRSKVLFLAPTRPLAIQHHRTFRDILNIGEMVVLTGMDAIKKREELWDKNRMIFATPQTIENDILRGLSLRDVSLIIVDECHRSVGNYSYVHIAEEYMKTAQNPLILGLTASPSSEDETIKEICKNLFIQRVEAKTEHDADVKPYIQEVKTEWIKVELPEEFKRVKKIISELLRDDLRELKKMNYLKSASLDKINKKTLLQVQSEIRKEIVSGMDSFIPASLVASALKINHALELLETQGISSLDNYLGRLRRQKSKAIKRLFTDQRVRSLVKIVHDLNVLGVDHPKLDELARIVKENRDKKIIVFTQYRDSVEKIIDKLNENGIMAHEFIGQASRDGKRGMTQREQVRVLEDFREGKYSVLCATSVAEEGIDIPKVDMVIFYEPIPSEIRSIQRRGRTGRSATGNVIVLMAKDTRDETYYWAAIHKERKMRKLIRKMRDRFEGDTGQQSLIKYSVNREKAGEEKKIRIYVDVRERNTEILKILREKARIEIRQLPVGDFILSDRVGVERKTTEDFLQSIIDKRLLSQANELSRNFEIPIMIIEGRESLHSLRDIHPNAIRGALVSLPIDFGISVIPSEDENDTANLLYMIAKREQEPEEREIALRGERKPVSLEERQRYIIESLPDVSAVLARRLLEKFGSVIDIVNASKKELMEVEGIGEKRAERIRKVVRSKYKK